MFTSVFRHFTPHCVANSIVHICFLVIFTACATADNNHIWPQKWWPSKWGPEDQKGAFNTITPEKVKAALKLADQGKIYRLGMIYESSMPLFGSRTFSLTIPGLPTGGPLGKNRVVWNDEFVVGELGQIGTQFDGPGHIGIVGDDDIARWYNGHALAHMQSSYGLEKNGVGKVGPAVTRGVLIDMVALNGRPLDKGEIITVKDIESAVAAAGIQPISEGDVVVFNTGWLRHWKDPEIFNSGCPGIGIEAAKYLIDKNISMVAADTWPVEAIPGEDPDKPFIVHQLMQPVNGIWFLENVNPTELAADKVYEFAFIFTPLPLKGATGSPGDPIAID